ncbi:MAG TPA: four helix bundle protein [Bacteroidales bacterium]|nr:four helix bundle protein [Bacteroidales bacterium]
MVSFNEKYKERTYKLAVEIVKYCVTLKEQKVPYPIIDQLLRSGTSFAANFRAASEARSDKEYFAKLCIAIEEGDESLMWINLLADTEIVSKNDAYSFLFSETEELVKIISTVKRKVGERLENNYYSNKKTNNIMNEIDEMIYDNFKNPNPDNP